MYLQLNDQPIFRLKVPYEEIDHRSGRQIIDYLKGKTDIMPALLVDRTAPPRREEPEAAPASREILDQQFDRFLSGFPLDEQETLEQIRNRLQELSSVGIEPEHLQEAIRDLQEELAQSDQDQQELEREKEVYQDLKRLSSALHLAEDDAFTHGALYNAGEREIARDRHSDKIKENEVPTQSEAEQPRSPHNQSPPR